MTRLLRRVLYTAAAITVVTAAAGFGLAILVIRAPQHCGWCDSDHSLTDLG